MTNERNFTAVIPGFYKTRDGQLAEVLQIMDPRLADADYPAWGLLENLTQSWTSDGNYQLDGPKQSADLITFLGTEKPREKKLVTKTVTRWANVYPGGNCSGAFTSQDEAERRKEPTRIACVELTGTYTAEEIV